MAKVIQFYIPQAFKLPVKCDVQRETGKVLQFPVEVVKKSA